jgi:hypothetical protein
LAEYVSIADGVEGFAYFDQETNELVTLDADAPGSAQTNLRPATAQEIEGAKRGFAARGFSQKALGLGEQAVSGATFGLAQSDSDEAEARRQVLEKENPLLKGAAKFAGTLAPTLLTGGAVGAAGAAAGLGGRALGVATFAAEELAQASAFELSEAAELDREVEIGNIAQGLMEGAAFLGVGRFAGKLFRRGEDAASAGAKASEAAADATKIGAGPADAVARTQAKAAEAAKAELKTPTRAEAKHYAQNKDEIHAEINDLGYQAGNRIFGREGSFQRAHSVQWKKTDIAGKMKDADGDGIVDALEGFADEAEALAAKIVDASHAGVPSPAAARSLRAQAQQLRAARAGVQVDTALGKARGGAEDAAIALDGYKRHLDELREKFGSTATKANDPLRRNVKLIDEVVEPIRKNLEDVKTWGKDWAEKQRGENALWSGKDGIITQRAHWQAELMERAPGAAGKYRTEWGTLPVFQMQGDITERILRLNPSKRRQVIEAIEKDLSATEKMSEIKQGIGGPEARAAVAEVRQHIAEFRDAVAEVKRLAQVQDVHGAYLRKAGGQTLADDLLDSVPVAGPIASRGLRKLRNEMTPEGIESKALAIDELRKRIARRQKMREGGGTIKGAPATTEPSIADMTPEALGADTIRAQAVDFLSKDPEFLKSGVPSAGPGRTAQGDAIRLKQRSPDGNGKLKGEGLFLVDGSNRLHVARQKGLTHLPGEILDAKGNVIYKGPIRVSGKAPEAAPDEVVGGFGSDGRKLTTEALKSAGKKVVTAGKETLLEAAGGTAAAGGAVGLAALAAETEAIREIDQHGRDTTERAMLALASPDAEVMRLPDMAARFQGDYPDLVTAYEARMSDLRKLAENPEEFIARTTEAFEPLANAGHPEVAAKLITRMQVGVRYLLENAPPTLGTSMWEPEGSPPDEIAVLQFAPIWEAVWHPLDTVRDVATRSAPPRAIKALKEVHPDVYSRLLVESFRTLAQAGPSVDFETKRYMDNVFGLGAAVGRSFSPQFSNLMAQARTDQKQARPSLGGESVVAPETATVGFSQGPTAIR